MGGRRMDCGWAWGQWKGAQTFAILRITEVVCTAVQEAKKWHKSDPLKSISSLAQHNNVQCARDCALHSRVHRPAVFQSHISACLSVCLTEL